MERNIFLSSKQADLVKEESSDELNYVISGRDEFYHTDYEDDFVKSV